MPTIRRNVLPTFEKVRIDGFTGPLNQSDWSYTCTNGSKIILFPESFTEDRELNRWRGLEVNGFILEEANELQEASFRKAIERAGSWVVPNIAVQPPPLILATFNPSGGWVKRVFYDPWKAGSLAAPYHFQPATILDNPHLPTAYLESLKSMPERDYKRFVEGDWTFISGAFFDELGADTHLVPTPDLQPYWTYWGSYDWGYRHPAIALSFAEDTDGQKYWLDTIRMHRMSDEAQATKVAENFPEKCKRLIFAGHDAFAKIQAHAATITSPSDVFAGHQLFLVRAHIERKSGWAAVRRALTRKQPDGTIGTPELLICDTPGNRWAIERLLELIPDETDPDDVLKIDANEDGEGGDDVGDALRYGIARVGAAKAPALDKGDKQQDRGLPFDYEKKQFPDQRPDLDLERILHGKRQQSNRVPPNTYKLPRTR